MENSAVWIEPLRVKTLFFMLLPVMFAGQHMQEKAKVPVKEQVDEAKALLTAQGTSVCGSGQKIEG